LASRTAPATLPWSWYSDPELLRCASELACNWKIAIESYRARRTSRPDPLLQSAPSAEAPISTTSSSRTDRRSRAEIEELIAFDDRRLMPERDKLIAHFQGLAREALG
jgi:hypothetical protein